LFYVLVGLLSGVLGGMGIGGGTILIPALIMFTNLNQQQSQGLNLLCFIPAALVAFITHLRGGYIETKFCMPLIITGLLGALLGASVAVKMPSSFLRRLFGIFLLFMALYEFFYKEKK
jgi:uncharacterized membrane protein YfcA